MEIEEFLLVKLNNIKQSAGVEGCVLTADAIKGYEMQKNEFIKQFGAGKEIVFPNYIV